MAPLGARPLLLLLMLLRSASAQHGKGHGHGKVHAELEAMRRWWCVDGPSASDNGGTLTCVRLHRHSLPEDSAERAVLRRKIKAIKASFRAGGEEHNHAEEIGAMHKAFCGLLCVAGRWHTDLSALCIDQPRVQYDGRNDVTRRG